MGITLTPSYGLRTSLTYAPMRVDHPPAKYINERGDHTGVLATRWDESARMGHVDNILIRIMPQAQ